MIATDRDALVCDLAETYGIFDMRALPATTLATLAVGLRDNSRIKLAMAGIKVPRDTIMQAAVVDRLSLLLWYITGGPKTGANQPRSMVSAVMGLDPVPQNMPVLSFDTPADFDTAWENATKEADHE